MPHPHKRIAKFDYIGMCPTRALNSLKLLVGVVEITEAAGGESLDAEEQIELLQLR